MNKNSESKKVKSLVFLGMMAMMSNAEPVYTPGFDPKTDPDYCEIDYDAEEPTQPT